MALERSIQQTHANRTVLLLARLYDLLVKIDRGYLREVEIATDPDLAGTDIADEAIVSGNMMFVNLLVQVASGADNGEVWREFEAMALRLISDGKKAGAIDILARIRWERVVEQRLDFKCNNTDAPYYARIFALKHPEHNQFFEFRKVS